MGNQVSMRDAAAKPVIGVDVRQAKSQMMTFVRVSESRMCERSIYYLASVAILPVEVVHTVGLLPTGLSLMSPLAIFHIEA